MNRKLFSVAKVIEEPIVNLTPLIDVVFVILIAFIVIAPFLELDRVELADASIIPQNSYSSVSETSAIAIYVRANDSILINGEQVAPNQLIEKLKKAKQLYPKARPQLFHEKTAEFGTYQIDKKCG